MGLGVVVVRLGEGLGEGLGGVGGGVGSVVRGGIRDDMGWVGVGLGWSGRSD